MLTDLAPLILSRVERLARTSVELRPSEALAAWLCGRGAWTEELAYALLRQGDLDAVHVAQDEQLVLWKVYSWRNVHKAAAALVLLDVWGERLDAEEQLRSACAFASLAGDLMPLTREEVRAVQAVTSAEVRDGYLRLASPARPERQPAHLDGPNWGPVASF